jgi:O-antigen biosynthesis protein WbqV
MRIVSRRAATAFGHDIVMAAVAFALSLYLRVGDDYFINFSQGLFWFYDAMFAATATAVFFWAGLYRGIWRYASLNDLLALARAVTLVILIYFPLMFLVTRLEGLPRSLVAINWLVLMALLGGPRFIYRLLKDGSIAQFLNTNGGRGGVPVLLIGATEDADLFIRAASRGAEPLYRVVGIVTGDALRVGRDIGGVPILGTIGETAEIIRQLDDRGSKPQRLILSGTTLDGATVRRLLDLADGLGIPLARLPRLTEFREPTKNAARPIEPVAIEDLLGRSQTVLDRAAMRDLVGGKRVLVTGAGGTIGSELSRQIAAFAPSRLSLLDNGEFALYAIEREILERFPGLPRQEVIADIRDRGRIDAIMADERPELVFHAAALKHVPIVEANPAEGVMTNVLGTRNVAEACRAHGVKAMVMISTDKAVNPANVMGASKRLAEGICQALDLVESRRSGGTRFVTVRFGNVLGSTGSVVPLFQRQLAAGGPLTVTHPEISRYFMTTREAVELVLQSSALAAADGEERGKIFVLDMGEPIKIAELARQMIRLAGLKPDKDIGVEFIGLRPGEKLHEELFHAGESLVPTKVPGIRLAAPRTIDYAMLSRALDELAEHAREGRIDRLLVVLKNMVPEYVANAEAKRTVPRGA